MDANQLRSGFRDFFVERGHTWLPSASLVPADPTLLFTVAGMVPFKPWFVGEETPAAARVISVQKCLRAGGKHNDLDAVGRTNRHLTFFEMMGNFSFGDYFKERAIPLAWELVTSVLTLDPSRLWVTVHESDGEAEEIWRDSTDVVPSQLQRMGEDNWWQMAETGPCGPSSEIYFDLGPSAGPGGGPALGSEERYIEIWNLVFMQHNRLADGTLDDLPKRCIDTGAGLERVLAVLQGVESVFHTDVLRSLVAAGEELAGREYGQDPDVDVTLRILADHSRAAAFLVSEGVLPSNEGRGYVLRRIIRRAVRRGAQLGMRDAVLAPIVERVAQLMGDAYPDLVERAGFVCDVVSSEEDRFRSTLRAGSSMLDEQLSSGATVLPGEVAFRLHDTFGFPVELTTEIAAERGVGVDLPGFEREMDRQRAQSRAAAAAGTSDRSDIYRDLVERFGPTLFLGYETTSAHAQVLAIVAGGETDIAGEARPGEFEVFLDRTPFYAEGGGQVGDTGVIESPDLLARVLDTTAPLQGLYRHRIVVERGQITEGMIVEAEVDSQRRDAIRRNHTGTHLLHWALRQVLGDHVRQQGSLVAPDRLRFDFSHHEAPSEEELQKVEDLVNDAILDDFPVEVEVKGRREAEAEGAMAIFGERYGERVRVVHAGPSSVELCGGTHVRALGMIGPFRITSEGSIASNTRRIEALTGEASIQRAREETSLLQRAASIVQARPEDLPNRIEELRKEGRGLREELRRLRSAALRQEATVLASSAEDGSVVARRDDLSREELRDLAIDTREQPGIRAVVLVGSPDGKGVALVGAVKADSGLRASELIQDAAKLVGGGGGRDPEIAVAGGRDTTRIEEALEVVRRRLAGE